MNHSSSEARWYVVHTYAGYENKVKESLTKAIENRNLSDFIFDIQIPVERTIEIDGDKQKEVEDKIFPSYVLIKMIMMDQSWYVVRNIRGVTGFVGPGSHPIPLTDEEVKALQLEKPEEGREDAAASVRLPFAVGDSVTIQRGMLVGKTAVVEAISPDCKRVTVKAQLFGRDTSMELDVADIKA